jgi:hypothetical protein
MGILQVSRDFHRQARLAQAAPVNVTSRAVDDEP